MKPKLKNLLFSPSEEKILKVLGRRTMSIIEITWDFYDGAPKKNANNGIAVLIRRINQKCKANDLNWKLDGKGGGRGGRTIWKRIYV